MTNHIFASRFVRNTLAGFGAVLLVALATVPVPAQAGVGAKMYNEFLEKGVIYPDEEWQDYVTEIGERLLAVSPHAGKTYTFVVVDQPTVNAWGRHKTPIFLSLGAFWRSLIAKTNWLECWVTKLVTSLAII